MNELYRLLQEVDSKEKSMSTNIIKPPFPYAGSKLRLVDKIVPLLPYTDTYIEPFGGSGAVLLNREPSSFEVFNDRYGAITDFYMVLKDQTKLSRLCELCEFSIHSKEEWIFNKQTWAGETDPVLRAYKWLYMVVYSFSSLGRNWGRSTSSNCNMSGKLISRKDCFYPIHNRIKRVQIENQDWRDTLKDYDNADAVFYIDPPYYEEINGLYKESLTKQDHAELLDTIFDMESFVAISGYTNNLYEEKPWDERYEWPLTTSIKSANPNENNYNTTHHLNSRVEQTEVLWIKDFK